MPYLADGIVILWFVVGMAGAILRDECGYWRALMFGAMGPMSWLLNNSLRDRSKLASHQEDLADRAHQ